MMTQRPRVLWALKINRREVNVPSVFRLMVLLGESDRRHRSMNCHERLSQLLVQSALFVGA